MITARQNPRTKKSDKRLTAPLRQDRIALLLSESGYLAVSVLADHLNVSEMTIRRDLDALFERGIAERAHGGAVSLSAYRVGRMDIFEPTVDERIHRNSDAKARIGAVAAGLVKPDQTIAVDIGSTTLCLAHAIKNSDVRIFTNSLKIARLLSGGSPRVYMPGGEIRGSEPSVVGSMARRQLENFRFDWAFIGVSGLSADGLYDYSLDDTEIKRSLLERSLRKVALIDSSKFDRMSIVKVCDLAAIDILICDKAPTGDLAAHLVAAGVDVRVAE